MNHQRQLRQAAAQAFFDSLGQLEETFVEAIEETLPPKSLDQPPPPPGSQTGPQNEPARQRVSAP
jgi:hypothetical protein